MHIPGPDRQIIQFQIRNTSHDYLLFLIFSSKLNAQNGKPKLRKNNVFKQ